MWRGGVGAAYRLPALSSAGASLATPCFRFHIPLRSLTLRPACSPGRLRDPLHQRLQQSRCLPCCSDCYRVERTSSRAGILPLWTSAFTAHPALSIGVERARALFCYDVAGRRVKTAKEVIHVERCADSGLYPSVEYHPREEILRGGHWPSA